MRLIDADKLQKDTEWDEQVDGFTSYSSAEISNAETVDAIPIEWIKDYVGPGVSDDIFQRNRKFVLNMIEDWEKENEINRCR